MKKNDFARLRATAERLTPVLRKYRAALIVLLAGTILITSGGKRPGAQQGGASADQAGEAGFSLAAFEDSLAQKLAAIEGVGRVGLLLSLDQTEKSVYAVNTRRTDSGSGGQNYESDLAVVSDGSYGETPVTVTSMLPAFRGAVVLCDGADNAQVRLAVTKAVTTACGIGADKVAVLKMAANA